MISFENTEIAFKSKSNKDLKRAYWLFKVVGNPILVKFGKWATNLAFKLGLPINGLIKKTIFKQFCGGESINDCDNAISSLGEFGIGTILDYSVEGKTSEEDFDATVEEIIATIDRGAATKNIPFAVFKITGISKFSILEKANNGIDQLTDKDLEDFNHMVERVDKICKRAYDQKVPLFIDAEETWIQDTIDRVTHQMMAKYNQGRAIIYNTIQMYRHDRLAFFKKSIEEAKTEGYYYGVKLVRGAYMEKERDRASEMGYPSPIQTDKAASDHDYDLAVALAIEEIKTVSLCAGTHNEESSKKLAELLISKGIEKNDPHVYFAQLLGMSDHISFNLAHNNYNVAKYVPYGPIKEVMPYLLRRADENTSVAGQTGRELTLIIKEKNRRKAVR